MDRDSLYNLLTLVTLAKIKSEKSPILMYKNETDYQLLKRFGIVGKKTRALVEICLEIGIAKYRENGDVYAINFRETLKILKDIADDEMKSIFNKNLRFYYNSIYQKTPFFKYDKIQKKGSTLFKQIKKQIERSVYLSQNILKQNECIKKKSDIISIYKKSESATNKKHKVLSKEEYKLLMRVNKKASSLNKTLAEYVCMLESNFCNSIKTGKNHIANILQCSPSKGRYFLKQMARENIILNKRSVYLHTNIKAEDNKSKDLLINKFTNNTFFFKSKYHKNYIQILGTTFNLNLNHLFTYINSNNINNTNNSNNNTNTININKGNIFINSITKISPMI